MKIFAKLCAVFFFFFMLHNINIIIRRMRLSWSHGLSIQRAFDIGDHSCTPVHEMEWCLRPI